MKKISDKTATNSAWLDDLMNETKGGRKETTRERLDREDMEQAERDSALSSSRIMAPLPSGVTYEGGYSTTNYFSSGSKGTYSKCAHTHPPLKITSPEGKEVVVYGGACGDPIHHNLDVYVALDAYTSHDPQAYPWHGTRQFIHFPINDMSVPKDPAEFKAMINWLSVQLLAGKSVHVGCLGGHGRTGLVLSALVQVISGNVDAIDYVRKNYCNKAVENTQQAQFLNKHFGITVVGGHKDAVYQASGWGSSVKAPSKQGSSGKVKLLKQKKGYEVASKEFSSKVIGVATPFVMTGNIWGAVLPT